MQPGGRRIAVAGHRSFHHLHERHVGIAALFARRHASDGAVEAPMQGSVQATKALARFLDGLAARPQPRLIDLGPVVGSNVTFFGEELGCKIFVEDLSADIDRHVREHRIEDLPAFLARRFSQPASSIDAILCWDLFDYLPRPAAESLARELVRLLRPSGSVLAFLSMVQPQAAAPPTYTKHVVIDRHRIEHRPYAAARGRERPLPNRDIERMFHPLRVTEQFLLKNSTREVLLRKANAEPSAVISEPSAVISEPSAVNSEPSAVNSEPSAVISEPRA